MHIAHLCADLQHCGLVTIDQALGLLDNFTKEKMLKYFFYTLFYIRQKLFIFSFLKSHASVEHLTDLTWLKTVFARSLQRFSDETDILHEILLTRRTPQGKNFPKFMKLCFFLTLTRWKVSIQTQSLISLKLIFYKISIFIQNCYVERVRTKTRNTILFKSLKSVFITTRSFVKNLMKKEVKICITKYLSCEISYEKIMSKLN